MRKFTKRAAAGFTGLVGTTSACLGLLYADVLQSGAVFSPGGILLDPGTYPDTEGEILQMELANRSDLNMVDLRIDVALYDEEGVPLEADDVPEGEMGRFIPYPMAIGARESVVGLMDESVSSNVGEVEYAYLCARFDGRVWFSEITESYLLERAPAGTLAKSRHKRQLSFFDSAECAEFSAEGLAFPALEMSSDEGA